MPAGTGKSKTSRTRNISLIRLSFPYIVLGHNALNKFHHGFEVPVLPGKAWKKYASDRGTVGQWPYSIGLIRDFIAEHPPEMLAEALTCTEYAMIGELLLRGGAVKSSDWSIGAGRTTRRAYEPPLAFTYNRGMSNIPPAAQSIFLNNSRVKRIVAFHDLDYTRKLYKCATESLLERIKP